MKQQRTAATSSNPSPGLTARAARGAAQQLGQHGLHGGAAAEHHGVVAVGGNQVVLVRDGALQALGNGLLAEVQVAEAADVLALVELVRGDLDAAHALHLLNRGN